MQTHPGRYHNVRRDGRPSGDYVWIQETAPQPPASIPRLYFPLSKTTVDSTIWERIPPNPMWTPYCQQELTLMVDTHYLSIRYRDADRDRMLNEEEWFIFESQKKKTGQGIWIHSDQMQSLQVNIKRWEDREGSEVELVIEYKPDKTTEEIRTLTADFNMEFRKYRKFELTFWEHACARFRRWSPAFKVPRTRPLIIAPSSEPLTTWASPIPQGYEEADPSTWVAPFSLEAPDCLHTRLPEQDCSQGEDEGHGKRRSNSLSSELGMNLVDTPLEGDLTTLDDTFDIDHAINGDLGLLLREIGKERDRIAQDSATVLKNTRIMGSLRIPLKAVVSSLDAYSSNNTPKRLLDESEGSSRSSSTRRKRNKNDEKNSLGRERSRSGDRGVDEVINRGSVGQGLHANATYLQPEDILNVCGQKTLSHVSLDKDASQQLDQRS